MVGVIESVCKEFDVPYFSCRGYPSASKVWAAGQRFIQYTEAGQAPIVLHFGDHDPSGIDMTRDIRSRLETFTDERIDVRRLALNMDQVQTYRPPPNTAKLTDSRCKQYLSIYGHESWELDALDPVVMAKLIRDEVIGLIDPVPWAERQATEAAGRATLASASENWSDIVAEL